MERTPAPPSRHVVRALAIWLWASEPAIAAEFLRAADMVFAYADDHFWGGSPLAVTMLHLILVLEGDALGWAFDPDKFACGPELELLGSQLDCANRVLRVTDARAHAISRDLRALLHEFPREHDPIPAARLSTVAGKLGHIAFPSRWGGMYALPWTRLLYTNGVPVETACSYSALLVVELGAKFCGGLYMLPQYHKALELRQGTAAFHRSGDPEVGDHGNSALHLPVPGSHRVALVLYQTHIAENVAAPDGTLPVEPEQADATAPAAEAGAAAGTA